VMRRRFAAEPVGQAGQDRTVHVGYSNMRPAAQAHLTA
jgi:hypothetical protein